MSSPSFLRRAGPLVLARFASAVVTTVVPLVLARAMAIAEYGTYKQLFLVGTTLTAIFTFGLPWSLLALIASSSAPWAWGLFAATLVARISLALEVGVKVMGDWQVWKLLWLLPVRDIVGIMTWAASFFGHTVVWRGERFEVKNGKLRRIAPINS